MGLFGGKESREKAAQIRAPRTSSGWGDILQWLKSREGLRVLDFGPTSPPNINYLTSLGHSVYMAHIVEDAAKPSWRVQAPGEKQANFDVEGFAAANFEFSAREFDVVLLWDTADYLPPELVPVLFERLRAVLRPGGRLLAFFHGTVDGPESGFARYQLTDSKELQLLASGSYKPQKTYNTRQIEQFLSGYADVRFFLAKDNVREVIANR